MPSAAFDPQISYGAHLVGFILGVAAGAVYYYFHRKTFQQAIVKIDIPDEDDVIVRRESDDEAVPLGHPRV
jgi:rhomboid protease GluP